MDITDISIYTDDGFSGKNTDRPAFTQMMNYVKAEKVSSVNLL